MTGAIPVFLSPTRNYHGIIRPIPKSEFLMETIQRKIDAHPLIEDKTRKPKIFTLTQCAYDGVMYSFCDQRVCSMAKSTRCILTKRGSRMRISTRFTKLLRD